MSKKNIIKIINDTGYNLVTDLNDNDNFEMYFKNDFQKNICSIIKPELLFFCETKDYKSISMGIVLGFEMDALYNIASPDEAIRAFEWLNSANNQLKEYNGKFGCNGYKPENLNHLFSYEYSAKTAFMEEFQRTLSEFKTAYLNATYNSKNKYTEYKPIELKNLTNLSNPK